MVGCSCATREFEGEDEQLSRKIIQIMKKQFFSSKSDRLLLALGANKNGHFGSPADAIREAIARLSSRGFSIVQVSNLYRTRPIGGGRQEAYFNAVALAVASVPPAPALRIMKRIEREAGRRKGGPNGPRPLDLDIIAAGGRIIGWPKTTRHEQHTTALPRTHRSGPRSRSRRWLTIPHPLMHLRSFVLVPLAEIAPHWRHPVLGLEVRRLLTRQPRLRGDAQRVVDPEGVLWQKGLC